MSSRFTERGQGSALGSALSIIKTVVESVSLPDKEFCGMLLAVSDLHVQRQ